MRGVVGVNEIQMLPTTHWILPFLKIYRARMYNKVSVLQTNQHCMYIHCGVWLASKQEQLYTACKKNVEICFIISVICILLCELPHDTLIKSFICCLWCPQKMWTQIHCERKQVHSEIKGKHPLNVPVHWIPQTLNQNNWASETCGADFTCVTLFLLLRQMPDNVSSSLLPQDRRDGSDFSTAHVPSGIATAKVTLFLSIKKPRNKQRYTSVSVSPVFMFLSTSILVLCLCCPPLLICRSRTGRTY